jgi:hypothetical protein
VLDVSYVFEGAAAIKGLVSVFNEDCSRSISISDGLQTIRTPSTQYNMTAVIPAEIFKSADVSTVARDVCGADRRRKSQPSEGLPGDSGGSSQTGCRETVKCSQLGLTPPRDL